MRTLCSLTCVKGKRAPAHYESFVFLTGIDLDQLRPIEDYCAIARLINKEATWFWTFQNTYHAVTKASVKGIPKLYSGVIDVSGAWLE